MNTYTAEQTPSRGVNLCRRADSSAARTLVQAVLVHLDANENQDRKRPRTKSSRENFERLVEAIICDVVYQVVFQNTTLLHISRVTAMKKSRYRLAWDSGYVRPSLLDRLEALNFIVQDKAARVPHHIKGLHYNETTIQAGDDLVTLALVYGVKNIYDFVLDTSTQTVMLLKSDEYVEVIEEGKEIEHPKQLVEFEDTHESLRQQAEIDQVNLCLSSFTVDVVSTDEAPIDPREVKVRGYYTCSDTTFQRGGRLFNKPLPYYMALSKEDRPCIIRQMGATYGPGISEIDFNALNPRMLYALAEVGIHESLRKDPYLIPGFERSRAGIKKTFNAMLFGESLPTWTMYPQNMVAEGLIGPLFHQEEYQSIQKVMAAIKLAHAPVAHLFGTKIGHRLMNLEVGLLRLIILRTSARGIPCLPVHDCLIVPRSCKRQVVRLMVRAFRDYTGTEGFVKIQ